ncbi:hypothetical protein [Rhodoferax koreensis]|uniref:hypothetical protein n=1 Tax=Rhodoferax koreensis TaxID=1842727 RepID=UPI0012FFA694|nr:hypothetical protein [Rhodoferax koreense]
MKRSNTTKWRVTAILIACIAAYTLHDGEEDLAKANTNPAKCTAASQPRPSPKSPHASEPDQEQGCVPIRNSRRHAQV